jgi:hypothetical protein
MRFLWLMIGLCVGVVVGRNKGDVPAPAYGALVLALAVVAFAAWKGGNRDRAEAVAVAVANANAAASAHLEAVLAAQATATGGSVQFVLADGQVLTSAALTGTVARSGRHALGDTADQASTATATDWQASR